MKTTAGATSGGLPANKKQAVTVKGLLSCQGFLLSCQESCCHVKDHAATVKDHAGTVKDHADTVMDHAGTVKDHAVLSRIMLPLHRLGGGCEVMIGFC